MKKRKELGRPRVDDPRVHLPHVVVRSSIINKMLLLARESNKYLSYHVEQAFSLYLQNFKK